KPTSVGRDEPGPTKAARHATPAALLLWGRFYAGQRAFIPARAPSPAPSAGMNPAPQNAPALALPLHPLFTGEAQGGPAASAQVAPALGHQAMALGAEREQAVRALAAVEVAGRLASRHFVLV